jgi:iron complex outermembrane recepter protein
MYSHKRGVRHLGVTLPALSAALLATSVCCVSTTTHAQTPLPGIVVEGKSQPVRRKPATAIKAAPQTNPAQTPGDTVADEGDATQRAESLTVPTTAEARRAFALVPGSVVVVPDTAYRNTTPASTIKDVLDYVPGVFVQPKWGDDSRLSIRGSGLSRNFHLRGIQLYMDGIPISTADGFGDFQELDPTAYRYVEVFKGPNALRFGAASLGGAINFVTPTGRDADLFGASVDFGSFGFKRLQANSGGVQGPVDAFITGSWQEQDGFRDHSSGESKRLSANVGYRLSEDLETRFYLNANEVRQRIPGSVAKDAALNSPRAPAAANVQDDWQRNIDTLRFANKTTWRMGPGTIVEFGVFGVDRHLMHPIFQWLDYRYDDYGTFGRLLDERRIGGFKNRLLVGANLHNGTVDTDQYVNAGGQKGALLSSSKNDSKNFTVYIENSFYVLPHLAIVAGTQFLDASRELTDKFLGDGNQSGQKSFDAWSPKAGLLWEVDRIWQVYANVARSAEVPSFGENSFSAAAAFDAEMQTATTFELGTRGRRADYTWDLALYRANVENELLCTAPFPVAAFCVVRNADKTIHQGLEAAFGASILKSMFTNGGRPDRLWLNVAYTFSDFRFDDDPIYGNNKLPGAPRHFVRAELLYKHPTGFYFGPNIEWVPESYMVDSANTLDTEAYAIWGLKAGYDPGKGFSVYVEGRNLSDTHYIASTGITNVADPSTTTLFEPGTGRAVFAGVKVAW